jgi:hypothetical protein
MALAEISGIGSRFGLSLECDGSVTISPAGGSPIGC